MESLIHSPAFNCVKMAWVAEVGPAERKCQLMLLRASSLSSPRITEYLCVFCVSPGWTGNEWNRVRNILWLVTCGAFDHFHVTLS